VFEKPDINPIGVHPQLSHNGRPLDGALFGAASLQPLSMHNSLV